MLSTLQDIVHLQTITILCYIANTDIPATTISVEIKEGEKLHRDISFDGGTLEVETTNNGEPWDSTVRMYDTNTGKVVASVRTYGRKQQMEVPAGNYRVSYNALKLKGLEKEAEVENIEIKPNETNSISHEFKR